ncbi:MAG TPA: adenylate/guanylate cyclase domain-containing protein, partial [Chryseolinea sp.]
MSSTRQLAAIMFTDIVGYTALMGADEQKAFQLLQKSRQLQVRLVDQNNGRWIKELGDGALTSFITASDAVRCAVSIQQECSSIPNLKLHIGIHLGEVMFENGDVFGEGVNIASRLQALASVGEILISESVYLNIRNKKEFVIEFYREETLKNVASQVKLYRVKTSSMAIEDANGFSTIRQKGTGLKQKNIAVFLFVCFVFLIAAIVYFNNSDKGKTQENAPINIEKSIAVLPFENMSNDQQQEFFANGITDEILNHLFKIGGWRIVSRTSTMAYKGSKKTTKEIANDLNVDHLLEGSVQKEGNRVRIRIRLINGRTDEQLWGDNYEIDYKEVFAIQSEIAQKVAAQLNVKI